MRKLLIILLLIVHTASSSGMVLSMHYCMGSFASMHIGQRDDKGCSTCGMQKSGCCHDDVKLIKIDNAQFLSTSLFVLPVHDQILINHSIVDIPIISFDTKAQEYSSASHYFDGPPIFILNCNFRI